MDGYRHTHAFDVRDYECDLQGVVNNANYLHYLEHARHALLIQLGLDFADLSRRGINLVVTRIEIDYLSPLRSGDAFVVRSNIERVSRLRFAFAQEIFKAPGDVPVARARVTGTSLNAVGRPAQFAEIDAALSAALAQ
jgi:acyl-CoA thioester hydrolase